MVDRRRLVYRWDLDKTYLRTEFDTLRDLLRTATEAPAQKRTVPGAAALLREIRATNPAGIYILSGSPEQMRRALEAKLRLDGIQWDSFTLKPSLRNLLRGRFRFLRDQVGYKLAALLESRVLLESGPQEILFGDDAESDAFVYSLYADICAGRVPTDALVAVLEQARVYPEDVPGLLRLASLVPPGDAVLRVFIHLDRVSPVSVFDELGGRVCPFHNYFQPALVLVEDGALDGAAALRVGADIVIDHAFSPDALLASFTDLVGRRLVGRVAAERLVEAMASGSQLAGPTAELQAFVRAIEERRDALPTVPSPRSAAIDYVDLYRREKARARAARRRALRRRGS